MSADAATPAAASPTPPPRGGFLIARWVFARVLGVIFFCAFASLGVQVRGLLGEHGIAPAAEFLKAVKSALGTDAWLQVPTLCWINSSDNFLVGICIAGCLVSIALAAGLAPAPCVVVLWALFLSICTVGSPFLNFQWDALLLETAFLAIFFLPWKVRPDWGRVSRVSYLARWLLWWLLFRLMFESGVVKLSSGDQTWRNWTALEYHFETQPLPLWTAWYVHQLPPFILSGVTVIMFVIELVAPWFVFAPRRWRHAAGWALAALQVGILTTGNYAYFNWLTLALCLLLFEDRAWPRRFRAWCPPATEPAPSAVWPLYLAGPLAALVMIITAMPLVGVFGTGWRWPEPFSGLRRALAPLESFNSYGLFAVMTTSRPEIVIEGSADGVAWQAYEFRWKPGDVRNHPQFVAPHQPRLDWQMWFAALGDVRENPWFIQFLVRLLQGSPEVTDLLAWNPFPRQPPRLIRAVLYDYHFTHWKDHTPAWWVREEKGLYCPALSLKTAEEEH